MKRVKKFMSNSGAEQKWKAERKEWFLFISQFSREREIEVWKKILSERNFLFTCGISNQFFFSFFSVKKFCYDFVLNLGWIGQSIEVFLKFIWVFCWIQNGKNWNYFLLFCSFSFFPFFRRVSGPIITCLLFCQHLDALLAERIFSLDFCAFVILKKFLNNFLITFSIFFQVVRAFFHDLAWSIFKEFL